MNHKLTIIMPCYNCAGTLEEALASVWTQGLKIPFEVVMVNDGSTDRTWALMQKLSVKYPGIKLLRHETNRGGGVTRNTAVKSATGDLIFPLDGDDILPKNMLPRLIQTLDEKNADGAVFERSQFFTNQPELKTENGNSKPEDLSKSVELKDLFEARENYLVLVNFLYTKKAFVAAGSYPEHHDFDTQGFGFRFVAAGQRAYVCPGSYYFHRQAIPGGSYFELVYEKGEYSKNIYLIYEDILHLFAKRVRLVIMEFDVFQNSKLDENSLISKIKQVFRDNPQDFFIADFKDFLKAGGADSYTEAHRSSQDPADIFFLGVHEFNKQHYVKALEYYQKLITTGKGTKLVEYNALKSRLGMSGQYPFVDLDRQAQNFSSAFVFKKQNINLNPNIFSRFVLKHPKLKNFLKRSYAKFK